MSEHVYFLTIGLFLGTILVVFAMRYHSLNLRARARIAQDEAYREIAAKAVEDHSRTAGAVSAVQSTLTDIGSRLATIERILKEVD